MSTRISLARSINKFVEISNKDQIISNMILLICNQKPKYEGFRMREIFSKIKSKINNANGSKLNMITTASPKKFDIYVSVARKSEW